MKKFLKTPQILLVLFIFSTTIMHAQFPPPPSTLDIIGDAAANQNDIKTYNIFSGTTTIYAATWTVTGGVIQSQSLSNISIKWTVVGVGVINYNVSSSTSGILKTKKFVTVGAAQAPNTPSSPTILNQNCTTATLISSGSPPSGITWYWQGTNSAGTSMATNSTSNYPVNATGTYYLRARNTSGTWSASSASVPVTLGTIGGTTWYQDSDGDGYGDPGSILVQCSQPTGYVSNSDDQCPTANGAGSPDGCPGTSSLSNENYIYNIVPQIATTSIPSNTNTSDYIKNVTYFDGLGRTKQSIAIRQSASQKDIVTHIEYNNFGQVEKEYLPYVPDATGDGMIKLSALSGTNNYYDTATYGNTTNPY